jgi:hypothetical protein
MYGRRSLDVYMQGLDKPDAVDDQSLSPQIPAQAWKHLQQGALLQAVVAFHRKETNFEQHPVQSIQTPAESAPTLGPAKGKSRDQSQSRGKKTDPTVALPKPAYFENKPFSDQFTVHGDINIHILKSCAKWKGLEITNSKHQFPRGLVIGIWNFAIGISPLEFGYCLEVEIWSLGFPACLRLGKA